MTNKKTNFVGIFAPGIEKNCTPMYYKLIRKPADEAVVHGRLFRVSHYFNKRTGVYVERLHPICDTIEYAASLILPLIYRIDVTYSRKIKRLTPVLLQVPGREDIRFLDGQEISLPKGQIMVSAEMEQHLSALWSSERQKNEETRLEIINL